MSRAGTKSSQGDDFQIAVVIHWIIRLLSDNDIIYIQAESNGIRGLSEKVTVDDIVVVYRNNHRRYIQAKKNHPTNRAWSLNDLSGNKKGQNNELVKAKEQLLADVVSFVDFYSATPFGDLKSLCDACREYPDFPAFQREAGGKQNNSLSDLCKKWGESAESSFELAKRIGFGSPHDSDEWKRLNLQELRRLVTNPDTALDVLESFINAHQSKRAGTSFEISKEQVFSRLRKRGVISAPSYAEQEILAKFIEISRIGRDWNRVVGGRQITRPELSSILQSINNKEESILVVDRPGSGKTCLLLDIAESLERNVY